MKKRLIVLAANASEERGEVLVVGCWEEGILDVIDAEEIDRIQTELKAQWVLEPLSYQWREIIVEVEEEDLLDAFVSPVVEGEVIT
jgi:tetrahydromethanopterin S-methyltransferase subunit A